MKITVANLDSYKSTIKEIFRLAGDYNSDLKDYDQKNFFTFYNLVRSLPYVPDPQGEETVSRPGYTIQLDWIGPRDCDDKTVLIISKCIREDKPFRVVVCGKKERPHHVYPEVHLNGNWYPADATYGDRCFFGKKLYSEKYRKEFYP